MVSALDFRSGGRWFEPSLCRRVVSLGKKLYSTLSLFTQVYKWVHAIIMLEGSLAINWHAIQRGVAIFASRYKNRTFKKGLCHAIFCYSSLHHFFTSSQLEHVIEILSKGWNLA